MFADIIKKTKHNKQIKNFNIIKNNKHIKAGIILVHYPSLVWELRVYVFTHIIQDDKVFRIR